MLAPMMNDPRWALLMQVNVDVGELVPVGRRTQGARRVVVLLISGGSAHSLSVNRGPSRRRANRRPAGSAGRSSQ
jgi:hypothetical protein